MAWPDEVPADLTYDDGGVAKPLREHAFVREAADLPTFVKRAFEQHREVGARIPLRFSPDPAKKVVEMESWRKDHLPKLYEAGVLAKPPSDPAIYEIKKPDDAVEGVNWSTERATKFASLGIKHGISKDAMGEFLALHREAIGATSAVLQTSYDDAILALKREFPDDFDARMEDSKRLSKVVFKSPATLEFLEKTGLGNDPEFLGIMMRLAPFAQNDSGLVESMKQGGTVTADNKEAAMAEVKAKLAAIMSDPKNPDHQGYMMGDPAVHRKIDEMYAAIHGKGTIEIGAGAVRPAGAS